MNQLATEEYIGFGDYRFTKVVEFGYSFQDFVSGKPVPVQGAHMNLHASGSFRGDRLNADMELVDYVQLFPNGRVELNIYGVLTGKEGGSVYFHGTGTAGSADDGTLPLTENIHMHSNEESHEWMNTRQFWAKGVVDPKEMSLRVHMFLA